MGCCCSEEEYLEAVAFEEEKQEASTPLNTSQARRRSSGEFTVELRTLQSPSDIWKAAPEIAQESILTLTDSSDILEELGILEDELTGRIIPVYPSEIPPLFASALDEGGDDPLTKVKPDTVEKPKLDKKLWNSHIRAGRKLEKQGDVEAALLRFNSALELTPDHKKLKKRIAKLKQFLKDPSASPLVTSPSGFKKSLKRARALERKGDDMGALEMFEKASALQPNHPKLQARIRRLKKKLGQE